MRVILYTHATDSHFEIYSRILLRSLPAGANLITTRGRQEGTGVFGEAGWREAVLQKLLTMKRAAEYAIEARCIGIWADCDVAFLCQRAIERCVMELGDSPICFQPGCYEGRETPDEVCTGFYAFRPVQEVVRLMDTALTQMRSDPEVAGDQIAVNLALRTLPALKCTFTPGLVFTPGLLPHDRRSPEEAARLCRALNSSIYHANFVEGNGAKMEFLAKVLDLSHGAFRQHCK